MFIELKPCDITFIYWLEAFSDSFPIDFQGKKLVSSS